MTQAIEGLYAAFGTMPRLHSIAPELRYFLSDSDERHLLNTPLRELNAGTLRSYLLEAQYTAEDWPDVLYLLPRMLELVTHEHIELDRIDGRLAYAKKEELPLTAAQQGALRDFALAYWDGVMARGDYYSDLLLRWETLGPFGVTRLELLEAWRAHPQGALALADSLQLNGRVPAEWSHPGVIARLEEALAAVSDQGDADLLRNAILIVGEKN